MTEANVVCRSLGPPGGPRSIASTLTSRLGGSVVTDATGKALEGRVEVNYNGQGWGTICQNGWSISAADVMCKMLGYNSAQSFSTGSSYGPEWDGCGSTESCAMVQNRICSVARTTVLWCPRVTTPRNYAICTPVSLLGLRNGKFVASGSMASASNRYTTGTSVNLTCDEGYAPTMNVTTVTCDETGTWQPYQPTCGTNVITSSTERYPNTVIAFSCAPGYTQQGVGSLKCLDNGSWTGSVPKCEPAPTVEASHVSPGAVAGAVLAILVAVGIIGVVVGVVIWKLSAYRAKNQYMSVHLDMDDDRINIVRGEGASVENLHDDDAPINIS
eukprot:Em0008g1090a